MDYGGDDIKLPPKGKRKPYEVDYESLSQSAVEKLMRDDVDYVYNVCGVDVSCHSHPSLLLAMLRSVNRKASRACCCVT